MFFATRNAIPFSNDWALLFRELFNFLAQLILLLLWLLILLHYCEKEERFWGGGLHLLGHLEVGEGAGVEVLLGVVFGESLHVVGGHHELVLEHLQLLLTV